MFFTQQLPVAPPTPTPNPDPHGDGALPPLDCDNANAAIRPGAADRPGDGIDQDCSGADAAYPVLKGRATFSWGFAGTRTVITKLVLNDLAGGETARITCKGHRLPVQDPDLRQPGQGQALADVAARQKRLSFAKERGSKCASPRRTPSALPRS